MTKELKLILARLPKLFLGFLIISIGITLMLTADLGMNPWGTFHSGISLKTGMTFGRASQLTGISIIILGLFIKVYPGVSTILNMFFIGFLVDIINGAHIIPQFNSFPLQFIELILGLFLFSYGLYVYLSCGLGAGPRDGLMVGLIRISGLNATYIKPAIEISAIAAGYLLGGKIGFGTVLVALSGGYIVNFIFKFHNFDPKKQKQLNLHDHMKAIQSTEY